MMLSKREKRMLYSLGCFLLVAIGVYLFILPAMNTRSMLSDQLVELEQQRLVRVQSIARMGALDTRVKALRKDIEQRSARYAPLLQTEALDSQFTAMLRRYNALPVAFTIGEIVNDAAIVYYGEKGAAETELDIADVPPLEEYMVAVKRTDADHTASVLNQMPPEEPPAVEVALPTTRAQQLTLEAIMKYDDAMAFLEELSSDPAILLTDTTITYVVTIEAPVAGTGTGTVTSDSVNMVVNFMNLLTPELPTTVSDLQSAAFS